MSVGRKLNRTSIVAVQLGPQKKNQTIYVCSIRFSWVLFRQKDTEIFLQMVLVRLVILHIAYYLFQWLWDF